MKLISAAIISLVLTGCSSLSLEIPSFWDDNQAARIIDVRKSVDDLDCAAAHAPQVKTIQHHLKWFELYSQSKRTPDVARLIQPMQATVDDFYKRSVENPGSAAYCELKKRVMITQGETVARAVLGRF
jgi:desulfoferrodoxin (superoxide reductase-like protein)